MSIRVFWLSAIFTIGLCLPSIAQNVTDAKAQEVPSIVVIPCKYMQASDAQSLIQQVFGDTECRIAADNRTNSVLVSGTKENQKRYMDLITAVDQPAKSTSEPSEPAQLLNLQADFLKKNMSLISQSATLSGVESAVDEASGLVILKGKKKDVEEVQSLIDRLKVVGDNITRGAAKPSSVVVRVLWLTSGKLPTEMISDNDPKLQQIIDRLAKQGIKGLAVGMQMISRCDPLPGFPGKCKLSGNVEFKDFQQELTVDASFSQSQSIPMFTGNLEIRATRSLSASGPGSKSMVQVDINAETNKYYVLSSAPMGNQHSVFVVQLLDDF